MNETYIELLKNWLASYFNESGKSGFQMRLNHFNMRERSAKQYLAASITLFTLISGVCLSPLIINKLAITEASVLGLSLILAGGVLIASIYFFFKSIKTISALLENHIGWAERVTGRILRNFVTGYSSEESTSDDPMETLTLIKQFWSLYEDEENQYISEIKIKQLSIMRYENIQALLLGINAIVYVGTLIAMLYYLR